MRKISLTATSFATVAIASAFIGAAYAADPMGAPGWTGFYVGADAGAALAKNSATWNPLPSPVGFGINAIAQSYSGVGALLGGHAGYDYQFAPVWVAGIEGDWALTSRATGSFNLPWTIVGTNTPLSPFAFQSMSTALDWLSSVRGRIGFLVTPSLLAYATGGVAWAEIKYHAQNTNGNSGGTAYNTLANVTQTQTGFTVGGGLEYAVSTHWFLRAEYLYYQFKSGPNVTVTSANFPANPSNYVWGKTDVSVARLGASYKF